MKGKIAQRMPRPAFPILALLALLSLTASPRAALAEPGPPCPESQGSLARIGCSLASALLPLAAGADVVVVELKSDRELPASAALRERLQTSVRLALGKAPATGEHSRRRVELRIEKRAGALRVTADLRRALGLWQRSRRRSVPAEAHAFVEAPIDAELRALIPPPPLVVSRVLKMKAPERGIVALACGALGADGAQELALVSRTSIRVGHVVGGGFVERRRLAWASLSSIAPTPLREPIASAEITSGSLRVGITDRRDGFELDAALGIKTRYEGLMPVPGGGCVERSGVGLSGRIGACSKGDATPSERLGSVLDALAGAASRKLARELATGKLSTTLPGGVETSGAVGAQLALGDADGDGISELAYSSPVLEGSEDRLTLVSLTGAKPKLRFELAAPTIGALAICADREGPSMAPIVLISDDELWLVL